MNVSSHTWKIHDLKQNSAEFGGIFYQKLYILLIHVVISAKLVTYEVSIN